MSTDNSVAPGRLFVLTGASGCGKTTLLNDICARAAVRRAPKFSEREQRGPDDDVQHVDNIEDPAIGCDIIYQMNDKRYGINTRAITDALGGGVDHVVILSDFRIIKRLKGELGDQVTVMYISSEIDEQKLSRVQASRHKFAPSAEQKQVLCTQFTRLQSAMNIEAWGRVVDCMGELLDCWKDALPESRSYGVRAQKIRAFFTRYIDYMGLFDHVILNYRAPEEMAEQAEKIIALYRQTPGVRRGKKHPPVFMVTAASGAGKATLMEGLNIMGADQIAITPKMAKRGPKTGDKRDGMTAIGKDGVFPSEYDWRWSFHKGGEFEGIQYAVSSQVIERNIAANRPQVFVANMGEIPEAKQRFGEHMVFIYLHATRTEEQVREFQIGNCDSVEEAERRIAESDEVYSSYIENIASIDHVLLNTEYEEDLHDQMFMLIGHHRMHKNL